MYTRIEPDTVINLKEAKFNADHQEFWQNRIVESSFLFETPKEMYNENIPKIRYRKEKDGDLLVGEEFYASGLLKFYGTYNEKGERHGKGIGYYDEGKMWLELGLDNRKKFVIQKEMCRCNYENGKLHGVLTYVKGDYHNTYIQINDPNATPTYSDKEVYRPVPITSIFTSGPEHYTRYACGHNSDRIRLNWREYIIAEQEFVNGEMTGSYKAYCILQSGEKIQTEHGRRKDGQFCGMYRIYDRTGKLKCIKDIDECYREKIQPKETQDDIITKYFPGVYGRKNKGFQSMHFFENGQIERMKKLKDQETKKSEFLSFDFNGKQKEIEVTIPKGQHPFLTPGKKVIMQCYFMDGLNIVHYKGFNTKISSFDVNGNLLSSGYEVRTKGHPKWDDYHGLRRKFTNDGAQQETSFVFDKGWYWKRTYHPNGKLASVIDKTKNIKTFYNENGSFKEVQYQNRDRYKITWENEHQKLYPKIKGSITWNGQYNGPVVSANMTEFGIVYTNSFYENGIEYPYEAFEKFDSMRRNLNAIQFEYPSYKEAFCIVSFREFKEIVETQLTDLNKMCKQIEFSSLSKPINEYKTKLETANDTLKELIKFQQKVCFMHDVFSVPEFTKDLKKDKGQYQDLIERWKSLVEYIESDQLAINFCNSVCADEIDHSLKMLKKDNKKFSKVENSVQMLLDRQRTKYGLSKAAKQEKIIEKIEKLKQNDKAVNKPSTSKQNTKPVNKPSTSKQNIISESKPSNSKNLTRTSLTQAKPTTNPSQTKNITKPETKIQTQKTPVIAKPKTAVPSNLRSTNKTQTSTTKITIQKSSKQVRPTTSSHQPTYKQETTKKGNLSSTATSYSRLDKPWNDYKKPKKTENAPKEPGVFSWVKEPDVKKD